MNRDYMLRLKLVTVKSIPDICNFKYTEYEARKHLRCLNTLHLET
jgi:hypothetical protein